MADLIKKGQEFAQEMQPLTEQPKHWQVEIQAKFLGKSCPKHGVLAGSFEKGFRDRTPPGAQEDGHLCSAGHVKLL